MDFYTPEKQKRDIEHEADSHPDLPNALIIGDSISIGYTPVTRNILQNVANIVHPNVNCGDTKRGLQNIQTWIGDVHWDVIHFNWGLHDLCYRHPDSKEYGNRDKIHGTISVPIDEYKDNLKLLVNILKGKSEHLVWANSTIVPEGEAGRFVDDVEKYNDAAYEIILEQDVSINDLYSLTKSFPAELFVAPGDVHFTEEGFKLIGKHVADIIQNILEM